VFIRSAIVYGRRGGIPAGFVESARKEGAARHVGNGKNRWPLVHIDDLATSTTPFSGAPTATLATALATSAAAISWNSTGGQRTMFPSVFLGR
jgi:hypothetical protein